VTRSVLRRLRDERGFTLTEMLASMAVLGILFAVFATVMSTTITHGTQEQETAALQQEARSAMERFAQELRQAYTGTTTWPILAIGTNTIRFQSPDRLQPFHLREIEWRLSGGNLQRRSITSTDTDGSPWAWPGGGIAAASWITQARSIRNASIFQFLDANNNSTGTLANVRKVTITLDVATVGQATRVFTYQTSVKPRVSVA
jgi:prepilin-type N-terminal cleavage/methylation domain-containing protein